MLEALNALDSRGYVPDGKPVPNGDAWIVQMIFRLFTEGRACREVAWQVTAAGGHSLRSSGGISSQAVLFILQNEIYVGDCCLQKQPPVHYLTKKPDLQAEYKSYYLKDAHTFIIDRKPWDKAQAILHKRKLAKGQASNAKGRTHISSMESSSVSIAARLIVGGRPKNAVAEAGKTIRLGAARNAGKARQETAA